jgi:hypothetical protein
VVAPIRAWRFESSPEHMTSSVRKIITILILAVILLLGIWGLHLLNKSADSRQSLPPLGSTPNSNVYTSSFPKFGFEYPSGVQIEDYRLLERDNPEELPRLAFCYPPDLNMCSSLTSLDVERASTRDIHALKYNYDRYYRNTVAPLQETYVLMGNHEARRSVFQNVHNPDKQDIWIQFIHEGFLISLWSFGEGPNGEKNEIAPTIQQMFISSFR